jgi:hypothetical protein
MSARATSPLSVFVAICLLLGLGACGGGSSEAPMPAPSPVPPVPTPTPPGTSDSALKQLAATFPAMPKDLTQLLQLRGGTTATFASGTPFNDLEYTLFDTDYMEGETNGYDTFMPAKPSRTNPGADQIKIVNTVNNIDLDSNYRGQRGARVILGTAELPQPFFLRGPDGIDNDYVVISNFDYNAGHVQLRGTASNYGLVRCTTAEGCRTDGYYLFYTAGSQPDLIAFIFRCDDIALPISGAAPRNPKALCNQTEALSITDQNQFRFALALPTTLSIASGATQLGTSGREIVGGVATDSAGNRYIVGMTDGSFTGGAVADARIYVTRVNANGVRGWTYELPMSDGSLLIDVVTDEQFLYAVGRTLGALPGFTNAGRWDAIALKLRLTDGSLVASHQWGNESLDGYGNVILDDAGNLYVSGAGSPAGPPGTDDKHLVAKLRAADLTTVWRQIVPPQATGQIFVSEAWGGLSYVPGAAPGTGKVVAAGWFMNAANGSTSANAFIEIWSDLDTAMPRRIASAVIASNGIEADWLLDNAVDAAGNVYAVGYTTGDLQGTALGRGDAFIVKFDPNLRNPVFRQLGTANNDAFRRMRIDGSGNVYAVGYTYGDYAGPNADPSRQTADVIVQKFDSALVPLGALQFGSANEERAYLSLRGATLDVAGMTEATLAGASAGSFDAFVVSVDSGTMRLRP